MLGHNANAGEVNTSEPGNLRLRFDAFSLEVGIVNDSGSAGVNDLTGWLGNARLQLPRCGPGCRVGDVDAFMDKIVKALRRGDQPDPGQVRLVRFRTTHRRPGYDRRSVAALLDELHHRLRGFHGAR